jgi:hypothetical protein
MAAAEAVLVEMVLLVQEQLGVQVVLVAAVVVMEAEHQVAVAMD